MDNGVFDAKKPSQNTNVGFDEVYVLSLPSFVWFKANYTPSDPRIWHSCNVAGNRQLLSVGGVNPSAANFATARNETDPFWEGMKVFDLTTLQWTNYYNATATPYVVPSVVAAHYASGSRYPSMWSNNDVQSLFLKASSISAKPTETSASVSPRPGVPNKANRSAAEVGGAVGAAAAVAVMVVAYYLLARHRANRKTDERKNRKLQQMSADWIPESLFPESDECCLKRQTRGQRSYMR